MFSVLKKFISRIILLFGGLVLIAVLVATFQIFRYEEKSIEIGGKPYVQRTDLLFDEKCIYPARKIMEGELERIAVEISTETDLDVCFLD